jgi:hypothetical protein
MSSPTVGSVSIAQPGNLRRQCDQLIPVWSRSQVVHDDSVDVPDPTLSTQVGETQAGNQLGPVSTTRERKGAIDGPLLQTASVHPPRTRKTS